MSVVRVYNESEFGEGTSSAMSGLVYSSKYFPGFLFRFVHFCCDGYILTAPWCSSQRCRFCAPLSFQRLANIFVTVYELRRFSRWLVYVDIMITFQMEMITP